MVEVLDEHLLTCAAAARLLRSVDRSRRYAPSTVWRWMTKGVSTAGGQRVRLESIRLGRRVLTSREALLRFARVAAEPFPAKGDGQGTDRASDDARARLIAADFYRSRR